MPIGKRYGRSMWAKNKGGCLTNIVTLVGQPLLLFIFFHLFLKKLSCRRIISRANNF